MSIFNIQSSIFNNKRGFTLIEVLFAILLISIGMLALAGMQATSVTGNVASMDMTTAVGLAEEMIERIRVNGGDNPGVYDGLNTKNCSVKNLFAFEDCNAWKARLEDSNFGLSNAVGTVVVTLNSPISNSAMVTVTVSWGNVITRTISLQTIVETWLT